MKIVIFGLTISSSWGNGHATKYRSLVKALFHAGHKVTFIEKDVEWYRSNRDLPEPSFCKLRLYDQWAASRAALLHCCADADAIVIGSYFPDAIAATTTLLDAGHGPLFFYDIDTPVTLERLRTQGRTEYLDPVFIPYYNAYLSFTGGPMLRELEQKFGAVWAIPFYCSVDPEIYRPSFVRKAFRCDLSYLGTYSADRQHNLMRLLDGAAELLPSRQFVVAGPLYPAEIRWRRNVRRIDHVYPGDHPAFYSSSRFTLNLTRQDMIEAGYSPSVRLFEASACGTAILSDYWPGLEEFLTPGEEVLLPTDACELTTILCRMTEIERLRMGSRARERVLTEHSSQHRAAQFADIVGACSRREDATAKLSS